MAYRLKDIIALFQLSAKKSLGQNFILDPMLLDKIAKLVLDGLACKNVLEIGPGPGGMTQALLQNGARVLAVEKDSRCVNALRLLKKEYPSDLKILEADALLLNEKEAVCEFFHLSDDDFFLPKKKPSLAGNLPYNISTRLLCKWLHQIHLFSRLTLMFQKEVGARLKASPSDASYGRLSVLTQWLCQVEEVLSLPAGAFTPAPKVDSVLVRLTPREKPLAPADFSCLEKVTAAAFGQRRKMLRSSLKSLGDAEEFCAAAGIKSSLRAENVPVEAYCAMARLLFEKTEKQKSAENVKELQK
jgi:16S rRNA (adenine1518-N6/adenine1519-N6)-dimethyltransferase